MVSREVSCVQSGNSIARAVASSGHVRDPLERLVELGVDALDVGEHVELADDPLVEREREAIVDEAPVKQRLRTAQVDHLNLWPPVLTAPIDGDRGMLANMEYGSLRPLLKR